MALVLVEDQFGLTGSGSAFVVDEDTLITNHHVIDGAVSIIVVFPDGTESKGSVMGFDVIHDLAAIRADTPSRAKRLEWNNSKREPLRTDVWAWGYPGSTVASFGTSVQPTLTDGIISQYQARDGVTFIQTNVDVHPGNSGGPLVTETGRVVGVVRSGLVNPWTGQTQSGLNLAVSLADHTTVVAAVIGGVKDTGEKFAPAGATLAGMGFVALYDDDDGRWCGPEGSSPDNYPGIVGLCLEASYPAALAGVTIDLEWKQDGTVICERTAVVTEEFRDGDLLFTCRPPSMRSGTYAITVTSGSRTIGTFSRQVTVSGAAAVNAYISQLLGEWYSTSDLLDQYTDIWIDTIDTSSLPSTELSELATLQKLASLSMVATLEEMRSHAAMSEPAVSQLHSRAIQFWNAQANHFGMLSQYALLQQPWSAVQASYVQLDVFYAPFLTSYCGVLVQYSLGAC